MSTLMHPRIARNHAQEGFFPTDDATLRGILRLLAPSEESIAFLDPCCGDGNAIATLANRDHFPFARRYGIEYHEGRAATAKPRVHELLVGSALDAHVTPQSIDCLFLNPPYGHPLQDGESDRKLERLEHQFLSDYFPALRAGGLLIYIVPGYSLDERRQKWLLSHFTELTVFAAGTDRYKQVVVMGIKHPGLLSADPAMLRRFAAWQSGAEPWPSLPTVAEPRYRLAGNDKTVRMRARTIDLDGMRALVAEHPCLWQSFDQHFCTTSDHGRLRPLHDLTDWHTCLLISAGVVGGLVDNGNRRLLVKGRTVKTKLIKTFENDEGEINREEHRDRFLTIITAIDMTEGTPFYGHILTIQ